MKARNREFNEARNKNLTKSSLNLSSVSNYNASSRQQNPANNQSLTSSFLKKSKPDVCVTCVNKKIATEKKTKDQDLKMKQIEQFKAKIEYQNSQRDIAKEKRLKMMMDAREYNKNLINTHQKQADTDKLLDSRYISEVLQQNLKKQGQQRERIDREKQQALKYRKELYLQKKMEEQKKNQEKIEKLKPEINQLKLTQTDRTKMVKQYSTELRKQMNNNSYRKLIEKERQINEEQQALKAGEQQFLRYTQFTKDNKPNHSINPEVFEQLKIIDYSKKIKKIEEREMKDREREEFYKKQRELYKSQTQRSLRLKKDYERDLKVQMTQRYLKSAAEKQQELSFPWKIEKYTEDVIKESRVVKPCEECKHEYDQKCMI